MDKKFYTIGPRSPSYKASGSGANLTQQFFPYIISKVQTYK